MLDKKKNELLERLLGSGMMEDIRNYFGYEEEDDSHDNKIVDDNTTQELFNAYWTYNGLINYGNSILESVDVFFDTVLSEE